MIKFNVHDHGRVRGRVHEENDLCDPCDVENGDGLCLYDLCDEENDDLYEESGGLLSLFYYREFE